MTGRAIIVTAATGIGAVFARQAAEAGARLVITSGDARTGWELAEQTGAEVWVGDLSGLHSAESVLAQCLSRFGRVDGLFNAAGLSGRRFGDGPAHECTDEGWEMTLAQNLAITFRMCRAVSGRMMEQKPGEDGMRGAILNMGSVLVESPEPRQFATHAYAAAKGAIEALTRSMAAYYASHRIRVNALAPGFVRTHVSESAPLKSELHDFLSKKQALTGGMIDAEDIGRAALFLLGGSAKSITGQILTVDAGWSVTGV